MRRTCLRRRSAVNDVQTATPRGAAPHHDILKISVEISAARAWSGPPRWVRALVTAWYSHRVHVLLGIHGRRDSAGVPDVRTSLLSLGQAQTAQLRARFAVMRASRAACRASASSSGTASPVPKYISSGVWPRKAEWGRRELCSTT